MSKITISKLQKYIRENDHHPERKHAYFLKLIEEIGELSEAILKDATPATKESFKGSIEEELYDVLYYTLALANCYDIDVEKWIYVKEKLNDEKYLRNRADLLLDTQ